MATTSVHIPLAYLDKIDALKIPQSTYIREAVKEKLERDEGYLASIEKQSAMVDSLMKQAEEENQNLQELHALHKEWKQKQERSRIRDIVITEYFTGSHQSKESLYEALKRGIKTDDDLEAVVNEVWKEMQMEESR